jgi:hypothetical protein
MKLRMKFVVLIAIAFSLVAGPFTAVASCSMLNPCQDGHSCCPLHEPDPVPQSCLINCADSQAVLPAKIALFEVAAIAPAANALPLTALVTVDARSEDCSPVAFADSSRYLRLCVLRR